MCAKIVKKEEFKPLYSNYIKIAGKWMRQSSANLDRLCEQQRLESLLHHDRFHYRRKAITSSYRYWREQGDFIHIAYEKAQITQLTGLNPPRNVNLDARTLLDWLPESLCMPSRPLLPPAKIDDLEAISKEELLAKIESGQIQLNYSYLPSRPLEPEPLNIDITQFPLVDPNKPPERVIYL